MIDYKNVPTIIHHILSANQLVGTLRDIYVKCGQAQQILLRYQSDPDFRAQADHLFTPAQLAELGEMIADANSLQASWFINHKSPLEIKE